MSRFTMSQLVRMFLVLGIVCFGWTAVANADPIYVANSSFEDTDASASPYYVATVGSWNQVSGFTASARNHTNPLGNGQMDISNAVGAQVGWLGASGVLDQTLALTNYEVGKAYTLTVGVAKWAADQANATVTLDLGLFYGGSSANSVVSRSLVSGDQSTTSLTYYSVNVAALTGSEAYAGKSIGIHLGSSGPGTMFIVDNVQLSSTIPEPSTFVLLGCGLLSLLAYAWRKRR